MNDTRQDAEPHEECQTPRSARAVSEAENHQLLQLGVTHHQAPQHWLFIFFFWQTLPKTGGSKSTRLPDLTVAFAFVITGWKSPCTSRSLHHAWKRDCAQYRTRPLKQHLVWLQLSTSFRHKDVKLESLFFFSKLQ